MFDKEYSFKGKHADMVNKLKSEFSTLNEDGTKIHGNSFFDTNYQIYELAPIIGFCYQQKGTIDKDNNNTSKIFPGEMIKYKDNFEFCFNLIMLLDKENEPDETKRIKKAFNKNVSSEDEQLYESYVLGGVEILYEKLIQNANTTADYINNLCDFLEDFNISFNEKLDLDKILETAAKSSY